MGHIRLGTVVENKDPKKLGRIKVEYNRFEGNSKEFRSEWVPVINQYSSSDSGGWFLPEIRDQVVLLVERNNLDHPIVLGSVYSGLTLPPKAGRSGDHNEDDHNNLKFIKTRSGHLLCFDDTEGQEAIVITDKNGNLLEMKDDTITVQNKKGSTITMKSGEIKVANPDGDSVTLSGGSVTVKSKSVKIDAAASVELGSGAAEALVKGQSFMSLFNSHSHVAPPTGGPTSPPMVPMTPAMLSMKVKTA